MPRPPFVPRRSESVRVDSLLTEVRPGKKRNGATGRLGMHWNPAGVHEGTVVAQSENPLDGQRLPPLRFRVFTLSVGRAENGVRLPDRFAPSDNTYQAPGVKRAHSLCDVDSRRLVGFNNRLGRRPLT